MLFLLEDIISSVCNEILLCLRVKTAQIECLCSLLNPFPTSIEWFNESVSVASVACASTLRRFFLTSFCLLLFPRQQRTAVCICEQAASFINIASHPSVGHSSRSAWVLFVCPCQVSQRWCFLSLVVHFLLSLMTHRICIFSEEIYHHTDKKEIRL